MDNTLHLFDELLEHDAGSKIFFPLARLYRKQGHLERAIEIVQKGLEHHPDYLEAQLYLVELLFEHNDMSGAQSNAQAVFSKLLGYDKFWICLRKAFAAEQRPSLALASFLMERAASGQDADLSRMLNSAVSNYEEEPEPSVAPREPARDLDAEEVAQICINSGIKTKTMAKLLIAQGEFAQAIKIYDDLLDSIADSAEHEELLELRATAQRLDADANPPADKNTKLYHVLNSLASRLEERGMAQS